MHDIPVGSIGVLQIQYFIKTVEFNSFTKAANHLHVTQSTISKTVASLENILGLQLFVRSKQSLRLTPAGQHLYESWCKIVQQLEISIEEAHNIQWGYTNSLAIGGLDSHRPDLSILPIVKSYQEEYPTMHIRLETRSAAELKMLLLNGELDCIFTVLYDVQDNEDAKAYSYEMMLECPLEVCMLNTNPLAQKETLTVGDLKASSFISISPLYLPSYTTMLKALCRPFGFSPNISCHTPGANSLPMNLITDNDIFICDRLFRDYNTDYLNYKPLENTRSGMVVCWRKEENRAEVLRFVEEALLFRRDDSNQE